MDQNEEYVAFARLVREREEAELAHGRPPAADEAEALTRLFEAVHAAREAAAGGASLAASAAEIGALALALARLGGGLDPSAAKHDSFRVLHLSRNRVGDASSRYAVVTPSRCVVMGADLDADFAMTDADIARVLPAVRAAVMELRASGKAAARVTVRGATVTAWTESGECSSHIGWSGP